MATALYDRVKMSTATTGTGTLTLGSAATGYRSFATAGVPNASVVSYAIEDAANWECGTGTYTSSGTTLSRTVTASSNANAAINLSGTANVFLTALAADVVTPGAATAFTAKQTFGGSSSILAANLKNVVEPITISATAATGTINYDITSQSLLYYTTSASANFTVNLRASSGTSLNTAMSTGETVTVAFYVTNGATPYYNNVVQVDGTTSGVSTKWQGGTAPAAGNASSIDVYTYSITKTGSAAFTVLASLTKFA